MKIPALESIESTFSMVVIRLIKSEVSERIVDRQTSFVVIGLIESEISERIVNRETLFLKKGLTDESEGQTDAL